MSGGDEQDDDRTRIVPLPVTPAKDDGPPSSEDDDATQFAAPLPDPDDPGEETDENPASAPSEEDVEETRFVQRMPPVAGPPPPLDPPRTTSIPVDGMGGAATVTVGTLVNNNYEITAVLKSGGMGEVYRGVEIGTGDPVAIKAILPELAEDEKAGLLFKREARTLRQLADEAIVRYYNYVHDRELDRYFLVMEFIEGVPLSDHIETHGPVPPTAARTLLKRLAKGLAKAHAQDVVHRDLSPDNVMLPDGLVGEARLIDFGIAKSNVVTEGTMHGQFAGKFKYVAPEQLGHYDGRIGPATDIYGLALLICAAVLGRPLDMGGSIVEAVQSRQAIPDLSAVPEELRPILSHMLEPDPMARPVSMDEVRRLLEQPELIPAKYRAGMPMPPAMDFTRRGGTVSPTASGPSFTTPPPGLQVPMGAQIAASGTQTGLGRTPSTTTMPPAPVPEPDRTGSRLLLAMAVVFVAILGGAGWYAFTEGLIGGADVVADQTGTPPATGGIPQPQTTTREGFLAGFDTGPCTYMARIGTGPNAGQIEGFSTTGDGFAGLPAAYEEKFGARPSVVPREVTQAQCAALDFARAVQGRGRVPVQMALSAETIASGDALNAQMAVPGDQSVWVVLISPRGAVYNLTGRLSEPVGGQRSLNFGLNLAQGQQAAPQLILAVASDTPLARAAAAQDGTQAAALLPLILEEIANRDGAATAALAHVLLTPAAPQQPATPAESAPTPD